MFSKFYRKFYMFVFYLSEMGSNNLNCFCQRLCIPCFSVHLCFDLKWLKLQMCISCQYFLLMSNGVSGTAKMQFTFLSSTCKFPHSINFLCSTIVSFSLASKFVMVFTEQIINGPNVRIAPNGGNWQQMPSCPLNGAALTINQIQKGDHSIFP